MKADCVDGEDFALVGAVALEGEVFGFVVDVLDGYAAFDTTDGIPGLVWEAGHDSRLPLERRGDGLQRCGY